eukprot:Colp12_sorted_trinity150504_noHs@1980
MSEVTGITKGEATEQVLKAVASTIEGGYDQAFFVVDVGEVVRKHREFIQLLPRVEPYYAMKCNPDPVLLRTLANLGTGFDCASQAEIEAVLQLGVPTDKIIYANPCKPASHVKFAAANGVHMVTFDNEHELHKMKEHNPNAKLVLRVLTDNSRSRCNLGTKFGVTADRVPRLLQVAKQLELDVCGVCFHCGSGCFDPTAFSDAVAVARSVFDEAKRLGFNMTTLDVGGGFPGAPSDGVSFESIAACLGKALDELFPPSMGVKIIAEPGRYYACASHTLAVNVLAKRVIPREQEVYDETTGTTTHVNNPLFMYYVNDGVYGSFNCTIFDHASVTPQLLKRAPPGSPAPPLFQCSLWGPTCDSMDCITKTATLPELEIGDWLFFEHMGAYTNAAASAFNGFAVSRPIYINTELDLLEPQCREAYMTAVFA